MTRILVASFISVICAFAATGAVLRGPITNPTTGKTYYLLGESTWPQAQAEAQTLGGNLATIESEAENTWICDNLGTNNSGQAIGLWIGLTDKDSEGVFVWVNGSASSYRKWGGGEPNNFGDEDYAMLWPSNGRAWFDYNNSTRMGDMPVHGLVEVSGNACGGESLIADQFSTNNLSTNWIAFLPFAESSVVITNGAIEFRNRAGLLSTNALPESISMSGSFTFVGTNDELKIVLRSDLTPFGATADLNGVVVAFNDQQNLLVISEANRSATAAIGFPFNRNVPYTFRIVDDGTLVQVFINSSETPNIVFGTSYSRGRQFAIYGRNLANTSIALHRIQVCTVFAPLNIYRAVELEIATAMGFAYRLEESHDLISWHPVYEPFIASASRTNFFLRAENETKFYRVATE